MKSENQNDKLASDLLWGAKAIGDYLGLDARKTFYAIESGSIPVTRVGRKLVASKSALARHFGAAQSAPAPEAA